MAVSGVSGPPATAAEPTQEETDAYYAQMLENTIIQPFLNDMKSLGEGFLSFDEQ
jgi:hypothetical protein